MSKRPRDEFEKIVMDEEMKKRILRKVFDSSLDNENKFEIKNKWNVKKNVIIKKSMFGIAACFTMVICIDIAKNNPQLFKDRTYNFNQEQVNEDSQYTENEDNKQSPEKDTETVKEDNGENIQVKESDTDKKNYEDNDYKNKIDKSEVIDKKNMKNETTADYSNKQYKSDNTTNNTGNSSTENSGQGSSTEIPDKDENDVLTKEDSFFIKECDTLKEAENLVGFKINDIKKLPDKFKSDSICVMSNQLIQIIYVNDNQDRINFRAGKSTEDISGDYNLYEFKETSELKGVTIELQGNRKENINLAKWKKDDISYALSLSNGMSKKQVLEIIESSF